MKKKICFYYYKLVVGGVEKMILNMLDAIDYDKYEVTLFMIDGGGEWVDKVNTNVKIKYYKKNTRYRYCVMFYTFPKLYRKLLLKQEFDLNIVVRYDELNHFHNFLGKNNITFVHGDLYYQEKARYTYEHTKYGIKLAKIIKSELNKMKNIYSVSDNAKESFDKYWGFNSKLLYNFINLEQIAKESKDEIDIIEPFFAVISRLDENKRVIDAIKAFELIKDIYVNHKLLIIGDGTEIDNLRAYTAEKNLDDKVCFLLSQSNPYKYMSKADIILFPSVEEAFGLVALEANAVGVPLIAYDNRGVSNLCKNSAIIIDHSPQLMAKAITDIMDNEDLKTKLINEGIRNARKYDIKEFADKLDNVIKENL